MTQSHASATVAGNRSLAYIGAGIVALVILTSAVVIAVSSSGRSAPADSPEGVLQRYVAAFTDGDYETAFAFFSSTVRAESSVREYEQLVRSYGGPYEGEPSRRVLLDEVVGTGDRVRVRLTVEEFYDGGLGGGSTYRSQREIRMVRQDEGWRIDELLVGLDPSPFYPALQ